MFSGTSAGSMLKGVESLFRKFGELQSFHFNLSVSRFNIFMQKERSRQTLVLYLVISPRNSKLQFTILISISFAVISYSLKVNKYNVVPSLRDC